MTNPTSQSSSVMNANGSVKKKSGPNVSRFELAAGLSRLGRHAWKVQ